MGSVILSGVSASYFRPANFAGRADAQSMDPLFEHWHGTAFRGS